MKEKKDALLDGADLSTLPETGRVIIGLSGGADSVALTHYAANRIDRERICCVHVNHMLRGAEAERDEAACKTFCGTLGLRLSVFREDIPAYARTHGLGEEEAGRTVRYRCFQSLAQSADDRILTAHNADDNAETILLNLARGSGLAGLCGIPPRRDNIFRPLLRVSREAIEGYCAAHELSYVQDSTNDADVYARNRIRHAVMPVLKELNPALLQATAGLSERLRLDRDYIRRQAERLLAEADTETGLRTEPLRQAHESVRTAALGLYAGRAGCGPLSAGHLWRLSTGLENGDRTSLPGGREAVCSCGLLRIEKQARSCDNPWQIPVNLGETALPNGKRLTLTKIPVGIYREECKINNLLFKSVLDCDTIIYNFIARGRRPGDRFAPAGRGLTKTVKQLLLEMGVPAGLRDDVVLLEMDGQVVFLEGAGPAESFQVTDGTKTVMQVTISC